MFDPISLASAGISLFNGGNPLDIAKGFVSKVPVVGGFLGGLLGGGGGLFGGISKPPEGQWFLSNSAAMNIVSTKDFKY